MVLDHVTASIPFMKIPNSLISETSIVGGFQAFRQFFLAAVQPKSSYLNHSVVWKPYVIVVRSYRFRKIAHLRIKFGWNIAKIDGLVYIQRVSWTVVANCGNSTRYSDPLGIGIFSYWYLHTSEQY